MDALEMMNEAKNYSSFPSFSLEMQMKEWQSLGDTINVQRPVCIPTDDVGNEK